MIRLQNILKASLQGVLKMCWRRLEDVLLMSWRRFRRRLEGVLKTSWRCLKMLFCKTPEDVLKTSWRRMTKANVLVLIKTSWRRLHQDECLLGILHDIFMIKLTIACSIDINLPASFCSYFISAIPEGSIKFPLLF